MNQRNLSSGTGTNSSSNLSAVNRYKPNKYLYQPDNRHWLQKRGMKVDYDQSQVKTLKRFFDEMQDHNQQIGLSQLEEILISLGFAHSVEEV